MKPKTPLPWSYEPNHLGDQIVRSPDGKIIVFFDAGAPEGSLEEPADLAYAVHAANALAGVTAALREANATLRDCKAALSQYHDAIVGEAASPDPCIHDEVIDAIRATAAALALAEGAPEASDG